MLFVGTGSISQIRLRSAEPTRGRKDRDMRVVEHFSAGTAGTASVGL